jgi:hypothetical protein
MPEDVRHLRERIDTLEKQLAAKGARRFEKPPGDLRAELAELAKKYDVNIQFTALEIASGQPAAARCRCICFA